MKNKSNKLLISVVVLVYNSERTIGACIESLVNQGDSMENYEILIVNDGSTDKTLQILSKYPVRIISHAHNQGIPRARNTGINNAKGEIIAFTDSDCIVSRDWISQIKKNLSKSSNVDALGGPLLSYRKNTKLIARYYGIIGDAYGNVGKLATNNSAYRKTVLFEVKGFNETLLTGEDVDLCWKIEDGGYNIAYDKKFIAFHQYRNNFTSIIKEQKNYGFGRKLLIKLYPDRFNFFERNFGVMFGLLIVYSIFSFFSIVFSRGLFQVLLYLNICLVFMFIFIRRARILIRIYTHEGFWKTALCALYFPIIDVSNIIGFLTKK